MAGSIHKVERRKGIVYEARYRDPDGRERSKTFPRRREAVAFLDATGEAVRRGEWRAPEGGRKTFGAWAAELRATTVHLRPSTRARDESYLRSLILPTFGGRPLGEIRQTEVTAWVAGLVAAGKSPATVRKAYQILGKTLNAAVDARLIASSPAARVKLPALLEEEMRHLSPEEVARLVAAMPQRWRAFVLLGAYGGLRVGEVAGLRRHRVDPLRSTVTVAEILQEVSGQLLTGEPKTRAGRRVVVLPRFVMDSLVEHLATFGGPDPDGHVFVGERGGPLRVPKFRRTVWATATRQAGLDGLRLHDLRHTAVTLWIAAGDNPKAVARRAGHTSVRTVYDRYAHVLDGSDERLAAALDAMARAAAAAPGAASVVPLPAPRPA